MHGQRTTLQQVLPAVESLDVELLIGLVTILLAQLGRDHDLAFARDGGFHLRKTMSY